MAITLITAPAVAARLLVPRLSRSVPLASALGALAGFAGLLLNYHLALPTGPTIAIVAVGEVALASLVARPWAGRRAPVELAHMPQAPSRVGAP
jgi:ABC-type Mn2+/Zn2+ transport system permease subunit